MVVGLTITVKVHIYNLAILVENVLQILRTHIPRQIAYIDLAVVISATTVGGHLCTCRKQALKLLTSWLGYVVTTAPRSSIALRSMVRPFTMRSTTIRFDREVT